MTTLNYKRAQIRHIFGKVKSCRIGNVRLSNKLFLRLERVTFTESSQQNPALSRTNFISENVGSRPFSRQLVAVCNFQRSAFALKNLTVNKLKLKKGHWITPTSEQMQLVHGDGNTLSPSWTRFPAIMHPWPGAFSLHKLKSIEGWFLQGTLQGNPCNPGFKV